MISKFKFSEIKIILQLKRRAFYLFFSPYDFKTKIVKTLNLEHHFCTRS